MDKKFIGLMIFFFLSVSIFTSIVIFNQPLTQMTKATEELQPSASNTHIFAWPLTIKANGVDKSTITIFGLNSKNNPVSLMNRKVVLTTTLGTAAEQPLNEEKKKKGEAVFVIYSSEIGIAELSATIDNIPLTRKVTVKFE